MVAKTKVKVSFDIKKIRKAVNRGNIDSLARAGFFVRREARKKILKHKKKLIEKTIDGKVRKIKEPAEVGRAPRTTGALRNAIKFKITKEESSSSGVRRIKAILE